MTLIIGACNSDAVLIVSDMRLSWSGVVREDESVKSGFFRTSDARIIYAYTGIAESKASNPALPFNTQAWLTGAIYDCSDAARPAADVVAALRDRAVAALRDRASADFKAHPALRVLSPQDRRLSILFLGFTYHQGPDGRRASTPFSAVLSNFQDVGGVDHAGAQDQFFLHIAPELTKQGQACSFLGIVGAIPRTRKEEFGALVREGKPLDALKGKAGQIIAEAAASPLADNSVGPNMMTAELVADPARPPHTHYQSATGGQIIHLIPMVDKGAGFAIAGVQLHTADRFPGKPGRNAPCPCGSGQKFKHCHGRT